jgi:hypothetical protein
VIRNVDQARAWLARERVATLTKTGELPSLVEEVAGEPVRGSWWSHPKGKLIFNVASGLEETEVVLVTRLVAGKVTFVHSSMWAPLLRIVTDAKWRKERRARLDLVARRVLARVERDGEATGPCEALKKSMLVHVEDLHTDKGHHATHFVAWERWASRTLAREAAKWSLEDARAQLRML